jgi:dTDP-4-dehydrorhamnose 3,5-epimerase
MKTISPKIWPNGDLAAAHEHAKANNEPVFVPAQLFTDDRGWSMMNQMQGVMGPQGQINFSVQYPGVVKAWHRHALQTDFWICLQGHIKVGVYRETDNVAWLLVIGEKRPGVMVIPPPLWHGAATCGDTPAGLLYYVTHAYNAAKPDEDRRAFDSVAGFPWHVRHG